GGVDDGRRAVLDGRTAVAEDRGPGLVPAAVLGRILHRVLVDLVRAGHDAHPRLVVVIRVLADEHRLAQAVADVDHAGRRVPQERPHARKARPVGQAQGPGVALPVVGDVVRTPEHGHHLVIVRIDGARDGVELFDLYRGRIVRRPGTQVLFHRSRHAGRVRRIGAGQAHIELF